MTNEIIYNSAELEEVISKLSETSALLEAVATSVATDFAVFKELELSTVAEDIKKDVDSLATNKTQLIRRLRGHSEDMITSEENLGKIVEDDTNNGSGYSGYTGGGGFSGVIGETVGGPSMLPNSQITDLADFDSFGQSLLVQNVNEKDPFNLNRLLFGGQNTKALIFYLKRFAPNLVFSTEDNFVIQKQLLELLAKNKDFNIFEQSLTFLITKEHLEKVAESSNITFSELLIEDKNKTLLFKTFHSLYYAPEIPDGLTNKEMSIYKNYINNIAKKLDITVETLLTNEIYIDVLKQGV